MFTSSSSWISSVVAFLVGCLLRWPFNARFCRAVYFIEILKCANLSSHLVNRALYCSCAICYVYSVVLELDDQYTNILLYRIAENKISLIPVLLLKFQLSDQVILFGIIQIMTGQCYWSDCVVVLFLP